MGPKYWLVLIRSICLAPEIPSDYTDYTYHPGCVSSSTPGLVSGLRPTQPLHAATRIYCKPPRVAGCSNGHGLHECHTPFWALEQRTHGQVALIEWPDLSPRYGGMYTASEVVYKGSTRALIILIDGWMDNPVLDPCVQGSTIHSDLRFLSQILYRKRTSDIRWPAIAVGGWGGHI